MSNEQDFSKGERGKFYHPDAVFDIPVYLEPDIAEYISGIAAKKDTDVNEIVNDWLRKNIALIRSADK